MPSTNPFSSSIGLWRRYIDDIFLIWKGDVQSLDQFFMWVNTLDPYLKFTHCFNKQEVVFLDLVIRTHHKPTAKNNLLEFSSFHPRPLRENLPYGQYLRLRRNCSDTNEYKIQANELTEKLKSRGYPTTILNKGNKRARNQPRAALLEETTKEPSSIPLTCVTTYSSLSDAMKKSDAGVLEANESHSSYQEALISNFYVKYGRHSGETCRDHYDLSCPYNGMNKPVFTIQEIGSDRSRVQVKCNYGSGFPSGPNYASSRVVGAVLSGDFVAFGDGDIRSRAGVGPGFHEEDNVRSSSVEEVPDFSGMFVEEPPNEEDAVEVDECAVGQPGGEGAGVMAWLKVQLQFRSRMVQEFSLVMLGGSRRVMPGEGQETWQIKNSPLVGYKEYFFPAQKDGRSGRAKGGLSIFTSIEYTWTPTSIDLDSTWMQCIKVEISPNLGLLIVNLYMHPGGKHKGKRIRQLVTTIKSLKSIYPSENMIIMGDFNLNLICGQEGTLPIHIEPRQGNQCRQNALGRKCASELEALHLQTLNGRGHLDRPAALTRVSKNSGSTVDYTLADPDLFHHISDFQIQERGESDHFPQTLILTIQPTKSEKAVPLSLNTKIFNLKWLNWNKGNLSILMASCHVLLQPSETSRDMVKTWENFVMEINKKHHSNNRGRKPTRKRGGEWYTPKLCQLKRQLNAFLRAERKKDPQLLQPTMNTIESLKKELKRETNLAKRMYKEKLACSILHASKLQNSKDFWAKINFMLNGQHRQFNSDMTDQLWTGHIDLLYNSSHNSLTDYNAEHPEELPRSSLSTKLVPKIFGNSPPSKDTGDTESFSLKQVSNTIKSLRADGAPGPNGLPNALFRKDPTFWASQLTPLFGHSLKTGNVPESWRGSILHPIYKSGSRADPNNYSLIALIDVEAKIYASNLLVELESWVSSTGIIPRTQTGFRPGLGTLTNLSALTLFVNKAIHNSTLLYTCFLDLKAAFDKVPRSNLWAKMKAWGVPPKLLGAIIELYSDTWVQVKKGDGRRLTKKFHTTNGLKQGCGKPGEKASSKKARVSMRKTKAEAEKRTLKQREGQKQQRERQKKERRKQKVDETRQAERMERERRIAEEIKRESSTLEEKLRKDVQWVKEKGQQREQNRIQEHSHIMHYVTGGNAGAMETHEENYVEEKFNQLLITYGINEDISAASKNIGERIQTLQQCLITRYIKTTGLNIWCHGSLNNVFEKKMSLTDQLSLLQTTVEVTLKDCDLDTTELQQYKHELDRVSSFLIHILGTLHKTNKTLAGRLSRAVFSELSRTSQDFLEHILFNGVWTPIQAVIFTLQVQEIGVPREKVEKILQQVQTYHFDITLIIASLRMKDAVQDPQQSMKQEKDKDLKNILSEIRTKHYPEQILSILEQVLSKVQVELPAYIDGKKMTEKCKAMISSINFENPDIETLVKVLIGLCVAVQDTTTIVMQSGEKIEGYFPRMIQLASLLTLLISKDPECSGCLLEIFTGEGKSSIVAMLALVHAIRGKKVDVITSSSVLARRDQEEWSKLYRMFDVSCSVVPPPGLDECTDSREIDKAIKKAYAADIVYGTVGNFAADILRQEFEKRKTRGDRAFDIAIVDEVDYMTLDSGVQVTYLSRAATGMRHLEQLLAAIWVKMCTCQRIQEAKTGDILWATGTQYFHKVAAAAIMGPNTSEHFSSLDILLPGLQLGFFTEEDVKKLQSTLVESDQTITQAPQDSAIKELMDKLGPAQQRDLLSIFQTVLEDAVVFEYYELKDGKASEFEISSTSDNKATSDHDKICILLQDHGCACVVMSEKDLIDGAVTELESRIRYSDTYQPPDKQENKDETFILLPGYLKEYTQNRMKVFVENAMKAIVMEKDREYMIESATDTSQVKSTSPIHEYHSIIPVDFKATGVLEKNKRWGDGLQQFLEMKHQLAISPLSNVTNFMSNFHFLQRYTKGTGMFGVSGTLGDEAEVGFLKKYYKVSCYVMPTHRHTKRTELPTLQVVGGRDAWIKSICEHVKEHTSPSQWGKGQAALVVCEDVKTAEKLQKELIELEAVSGKITLYTRSDKHDVERVTFGPGDVIIATNLGGRGTDVKVTQCVNDSGGLFVILTHFPTNIRVEKQIFGRTSRKGSPGMVQMILNYDDLSPSYQGQPIEVMRRLRAEYEKKRIEETEKNELLEVQLREELFEEFCKHLDKFEGKFDKREKTDIYSVKNVRTLISPKSDTKFDYRPALNALKESWALWLTLHEKDIEDHKDIHKLKADLGQVIQKRADSLLRGESDNFYDFIKQAMDRMYLHTQNKRSDYGALSFWQKAEKTDRVYRAVSLYNQAYISINMRQKGYMQKALDLLNESKQMIDVYVSEVSNTTVSCQMSCIAKFEPHNKDEPNFTKQMQTRMSLFKSWIDYIDKSLAKLVELQKSNSKARTKDQAVFSLSTDRGLITTDEMTVLYDYGLSFVFEVEKKPEFCIDALICFILGVTQVVAGILLVTITSGVASQIGLGLIGEGISDMISGIEGMIRGSFSWAEWASAKALSIGLSLISGVFGFINRAAPAMKYSAKALFTGSKTFSTAASEVIQSGRLVLSSAKSAVSSVGKEAFSQSLRSLATSSAVRNSFLQAAKYAGQELCKQGALRGLNYGLPKGLEAAARAMFKSHFKDKINNLVKQTNLLDEAIVKFVVVKGVPECALRPEKPDNFRIPESSKEGMKTIMTDICQGAVGDVCRDNEVLNMCLKYAEQVLLLGVQKTKLNAAGQIGVGVATGILKNAADYSHYSKVMKLLEARVIPFIITECHKYFEPAEYREDGRCNLQDVKKTKDALLDLISEVINDKFTEFISSRLVNSLLTPVQKGINKCAGKIIDNVVGKNKTQRFFIEQHFQKNMKKMAAGGEAAAAALPEAEHQVLAEKVQELADPGRPATELDLNVLTKSDLLEGKGVRLTVLDEKQKLISTQIYPGKDPAAGVVSLQLQKVKQDASGKNWIGKTVNRVKGEESAYSGHFILVAPDGSTVPGHIDGKNSLFHSLAMAKGLETEDRINMAAVELKMKVHKEVLENLDRYLPLVTREMEFEKLYTTPGRYTIQGEDLLGTVEDNASLQESTSCKFFLPPTRPLSYHSWQKRSKNCRRANLGITKYRKKRRNHSW
ncbi:uncharacterized protein LOC144819159 [Lissotriton helveticus]